MPEHTKRQHMISRRDQKMSQRRRGLQHMISTRDKCQSRNLKWEEFIKDCIKVTNTSDIHSDKWSIEDEELVNKERSKNTRSGRLINNNSVIKIYDKKWRSSEVCKVVMLLMNITFMLNKL
ncbi:unnamed protein product [Rhizophagus irregularis]|nr:unnamed protein product [Rhizophagus irregularis]